MRQVCLGSQLYINRFDTPEQVRNWVSGMAESGLRLMRLFVLWDLTEPRQGEWDWAAYDAAFDAAEEFGLGVVPTLMAQSPPGWMRVTDGSQAIGDVDDPAYWQDALAWSQVVVKHYANHPALHSWILWNEASRFIQQDHPEAQKAYREWLRERWDNDIAAYNRRVFKQYDNFEQILDNSGARTAELAFKANTQGIDWLWFTIHDLMSRLSDLAQVVRTHDGKHPVHVNPHNLGMSVMAAGQSLWSEAEIVDFLGCSAHAPWHSVRFPHDRIHQSIACFSDMTRATSPDPDGRFWVSELQGGPTLYSAETGSYLTPEELRRWLWLSIGGGAEAVVFWCYNQRREGYEAGEWGLLGVDGQATRRLDICREVAKILEQHEALFSSAQPIKPHVVVLHDENSEALFHVDGEGLDPGNPRNKNAYHDGLCGAWLWANQLGYEVGFINAEAVRSRGVDPEVALILAPSATCLDGALAKELSVFCARGGTLIADGLCGFKNKDGIILETRPELKMLFGAHLHDPGAAVEEPIHWENTQISKPWWLRLDLTNTADARVLARWESDQAPAVVAKQHGSLGHAIWLGTLCFQSCLHQPENKNLDILRQIFPDLFIKKQGLVHISKPSKNLNQRRLALPEDEELFTIIADTQTYEASISAQCPCKILDIYSYNSWELSTGESCQIKLQKGIGILKVTPD